MKRILVYQSNYVLTALANITQSQNLRPGLVSTPILEFQVRRVLTINFKLFPAGRILISQFNLKIQVCWPDEKIEVLEYCYLEYKMLFFLMLETWIKMVWTNFKS